MDNLNELYATKAISQIPRILSMMDRNEYSPTYGCFDRIYWLDKEIDFPSAILQLNLHNLAMVYSYNYPHNIFFEKEKIKKWSFAGMEFCSKIQHRDGSFDEFYPNERGWAGPTGFLLFSIVDSYNILNEEMTDELKEKTREMSLKAARYLAKYDEIGILANHHAMALLPIYYTYKAFGEEKLLKDFHIKFRIFEDLQSTEGWFLEYDGADIGYLSATISFLGKLYKMMDDEDIKTKILDMVEKAIAFSSYFVYPNNYFAGTIGSRQTLHFYPHGYEIFSENFPIARAIADKMLEGLLEGKLVSPEIMPWRYLGYRVQEYLLTHLDYKPDVSVTEKLPYEKNDFTKYFDDARMLIVRKHGYYLVANLAKGGVIKVFNLDESNLIYNDCGIIATLNNGKIISTQWIDDRYNIDANEQKATVSGNFHYVPVKLPTPIKMMLFRAGLLSIAWNARLAYQLKGLIRNLFITKSNDASIRFRREIKYENETIEVTDLIELETSKKIQSGKIGDEFSIRYVPQSLYFQSQELNIDGFYLEKDMINKLNHDKKLEVKRLINPTKNLIERDWK